MRRVLSLYKVHGDSALLVLNGTFLNCINALVALTWQYIHRTSAIIMNFWRDNRIQWELAYSKYHQYNVFIFFLAEVAAYEAKKAQLEAKKERIDPKEIVRPKISLQSCLDALTAQETVDDFYSAAVKCKTKAFRYILLCITLCICTSHCIAFVVQVVQIWKVPQLSNIYHVDWRLYWNYCNM